MQSDLFHVLTVNVEKITYQLLKDKFFSLSIL